MKSARKKKFFRSRRQTRLNSQVFTYFQKLGIYITYPEDGTLGNLDTYLMDKRVKIEDVSPFIVSPYWHHSV